MTKHRSRSPLARRAKVEGIYSGIANPYSKNEESDNEEEDYKVVVLSADEDSEGPEGDTTLVPGAVQHVYQTGRPSHQGVKESLDTNERPEKKKK